MGMFQQIKQLRETTAALPGVIAQAGELRNAALAYQQNSRQLATPGLSADDPRLAPIAGVDLASYARVVKVSTARGEHASVVAGQLGIDEASWLAAAAGWPLRMNGDMALAVEYGTVYQGVA
ncbi:hypothetical protein acdb102_13660 [Acidothermaceae bacterium B102]|nr:hypothetical protein acdb102_13660 [Acidothermaceae bacterium B102]